jgi:hypothetical protein
VRWLFAFVFNTVQSSGGLGQPFLMKNSELTLEEEFLVVLPPRLAA